ncbi:MAG: protein kinase domain-containing protein [Solirubrobacterales bacterium]
MRGTVISDRYELGDLLGSGGMSSVFQATDSVLEREVAVKILATHLSDDEKFVARFRREALAVARLIHPNIVQVYDTGVDEGNHFIVMEYVEGRSGAQLLQAKGALGPQVAVEIGVQACAGLEYAHRQGIVHRDVKPGNLMVIGGPAVESSEFDTDAMTIKLTDFGIARAAEQTRLTQVGSVVGTAAYLAPEQARGDEATSASDVYALGVVLYQLLTGRLPYEGSTLAELAIRRDNERPLAPSIYDDTVPQTLSDAVLKALENDVADRYGTARSLASGLRLGLAGEDPTNIDGEAPTRALTGEPVTGRTRRMAAEEPATPAAPQPIPRPHRAAPQPPPQRSRQPARKKRSAFGTLMRTLGALLLVAVLAAIIVAVVLLVTDAGQSTNVGEFLKENVDEQLQSLDDFIRENTQ